LGTTASLSEQPLVACHECDMLQRQPLVAHHGSVQCCRCGALLFRNIPNAIDRTIALSMAGLILYVIANFFPFLAFEAGGQSTQTNLIAGVRQLYEQGIWALAALVLFTCIFAPLCQLLLMLYIFVPLKFNKVAVHTRPAFRVLLRITEWNMIEVFMIGVLVALVKLVKMADIIPGTAMWSFVGLVFVVTGAATSIDGRNVWRCLDEQK